MAFKPGAPRPAKAGRKKGVPNKLKLLSVRQSLANAEFDFAAEIKKLLGSKDLGAADKFAILKWLADFHPASPLDDLDDQPQDEASLLALAAD